MFNALTPSQLLTGIGRTLRMAADATGALEGYERSQVLSAYSVTRLLASEQAAAEHLLVDTRASLLGALDGDERPAARRAHEHIAQAPDGIAIGFALVDLFKELPDDDATRTSLHGMLREMIDREVAILDTPAA